MGGTKNKPQERVSLGSIGSTEISHWAQVKVFKVLLLTANMFVSIGHVKSFNLLKNNCHLRQVTFLTTCVTSADIYFMKDKNCWNFCPSSNLILNCCNMIQDWLEKHCIFLNYKLGFLLMPARKRGKYAREKGESRKRWEGKNIRDYCLPSIEDKQLFRRLITSMNIYSMVASSYCDKLILILLSTLNKSTFGTEWWFFFFLARLFKMRWHIFLNILLFSLFFTPPSIISHIPPRRLSSRNHSGCFTLHARPIHKPLLYRSINANKRRSDSQWKS